MIRKLLLAAILALPATALIHNSAASDPIPGCYPCRPGPPGGGASSPASTPAGPGI